jgi:hypothetical protein
MERDHATLARSMRKVPSIHVVFEEAFVRPEPEVWAAKAR